MNANSARAVLDSGSAAVSFEDADPAESLYYSPKKLPV